MLAVAWRGVQFILIEGHTGQDEAADAGGEAEQYEAQEEEQEDEDADVETGHSTSDGRSAEGDGRTASGEFHPRPVHVSSTAPNELGAAVAGRQRPSTHRPAALLALTHRRPHSTLGAPRDASRPNGGAEAEETPQPLHRPQHSSRTLAASSPSASPIRSMLHQAGLQALSNLPSIALTSTAASPPPAPLTAATTAQHASVGDEGRGDGVAVEAETGAGSAPLTASTHRGVLTALMNLSMGLSQIVSATAGGLLINYVGDITVVFVVSGALCVAVNLLVALYGWSSVDGAAAAEKENGKRADKTEAPPPSAELSRERERGDSQSRGREER